MHIAAAVANTFMLISAMLVIIENLAEIALAIFTKGPTGSIVWRLCG